MTPNPLSQTCQLDLQHRERHSMSQPPSPPAPVFSLLYLPPPSPPPPTPPPLTDSPLTLPPSISPTTLASAPVQKKPVIYPHPSPSIRQLIRQFETLARPAEEGVQEIRLRHGRYVSAVVVVDRGVQVCEGVHEAKEQEGDL